MTCLYYLLILLVLVGPTSVAWAGPAEEIAQVDQQAIQCFNDGNLEKCVALYADDAVSISALAPFRIEGKEALQANYAGAFQSFPTRRFLGRQTAIRVYGGNTGVLNRYYTATLVDRAGNAATIHGRQSVTFVRLGTQWRIADVHLSTPIVCRRVVQVPPHERRIPFGARRILWSLDRSRGYPVRRPAAVRTAAPTSSASRAAPPSKVMCPAQTSRCSRSSSRSLTAASGQFWSQRLFADVGWPPSPRGMR